MDKSFKPTILILTAIILFIVLGILAVVLYFPSLGHSWKLYRFVDRFSEKYVED